MDSPVPPGVVSDGDGSHSRDQLHRPRYRALQAKGESETGNAEPVVEQFVLRRVEHGRTETHHDLQNEEVI